MKEVNSLPESGTQLVYFTAPWCGPCRSMRPVMETLEIPGVEILKVDVDASADLAKAYDVRGIPAFLVLVDGKEIKRRSGVCDKNALTNLVEEATF